MDPAGTQMPFLVSLIPICASVSYNVFIECPAIYEVIEMIFRKHLIHHSINNAHFIKVSLLFKW